MAKARKKILVLGGTGFIGSSLMKQLSSLGEQYDVSLLGHKRINYKRYEHVNLITGDLATFDLEWIRIINPDVIVHMARMSGSSKLSRHLAAKKGKKANVRLINYLQEHKLNTKVIYISGTLVYGSNGDQLVDELIPMNPTSFAKQYIKAEEPWMLELERNNPNVLILRPPWVIGRNSWFKHFYADFIKKEKIVPLIGEGSNWMSLLDVDDCAGLILHFIEKSVSGQSCNLCIPDNYIRYKDFVGHVATISGNPVVYFSKNQVIKKWNQTIYEAFSFSLKSSTAYPNIFDDYEFKHPTIQEMIKKNLV